MKVVSIKLQIGKIEIDVTPEEAKKLYEELQKVVGVKQEFSIPYMPPLPATYPDYPRYDLVPMYSLHVQI